MKKRNHLLATLLLCTLTIFTSCGDDDDPVINGGEEEVVKTMTVDASAYDKWVYINLTDGSSVTHDIDPVAGTYSGDVAVLVMGQDQGSAEGLKLEVTRISGDSVNLVLKDFAFGQYGTIGDISSGAKVVVDSINNQLGYTLTGGSVSTSIEYNGKPMNVTATSAGSVVGQQIELITTVNLGTMPMPITATYTGTLEAGTVDETSFTWDIALHRWDVKTNGGTAIETEATTIADLTEIPATGYVADELSSEITFDMTNMMNGYIGYATGYVNKELSKWMDADLGDMPPTYTMSGKAYVLKTSAGNYAKINFTDYTDDANEKGHITFEYVYPAK